MKTDEAVALFLLDRDLLVNAQAKLSANVEPGLIICPSPTMESTATDVTYLDGDQPKYDTISPHRNGSDCGHSPFCGDQSVMKTKCKIVSLQLKSENKDFGAVSSIVAEVLWNQPEEVKLCSEDKNSHAAAEQPQETHNDQKRFFRTQSHQCQHAKKHHKRVKPFKCTYCRKRFTFQNTLIVHLRTHAKEKPFLCPVCGMNFPLMSHIKSHTKTHAKRTSAMINVKEEEDAVGGFVSSDGGELGWDSSSKVIPNVHQTDKQLDRIMERSCCCHVCGRKFSHSEALQRHQRTHNGAKLYKCHQCGTAFSVLHRLKRHLLIHAREKPFCCPVCDKRFSHKDRLKEHLSMHGWSAGAKETAEALGGVETASTHISSDASRLEQKSAGKAADVTLPGDTHTSVPAQPEHNHSPKRAPRKRWKKTDSVELFSCTECSKGFRSIYTRDRHLREKHGKHPLHKCCDCGQTFKVSRSLTVHQRIYHPAPAAAVEPEEERSAPKTYVCSTCGKQFPTSASLKRHLIIHSGKKPYKCTLCGRGFTQIGNLKTHQKVHKAGKFTNMAASEESFPQPEQAQSSVEICFCHLCWTQFSEKQLLEEHLKQVHESKKPFSCTQCGKRFTSIQKLKEHEAGHKGLKPHQCSKCDKGFLSSKGLENHMRDHTGEKPFPCIMCGKRFKQESTLRAHSVTHSGERPHLCSICGKRYARTEELKVHLRVHTGEKPYQCDECGKSFYYRQGFNNHKKTHSAKPIGPTRQLGRPRQLASARKSSRPRKISQRAPPDSDGEDLTWEPPDLGNRPLHHLGNQENPTAENHSQTSAWNSGHYTAFSLWDQNPNTSPWSAAEGLQAYGAPAGASNNFSDQFRATVDQEPFKESCPVEQPSWPSGTSSGSPASELGLTTPLQHNTTSEKMHLSTTSAEGNHREHRPEPQDQDHRTAPTGETEHGSSHQQPQEKPSEVPRRLKKSYDCPTCGRVFSHNTALQRHLVIHAGKRPFKCFICGRGFSQRGNLKTHMKVHRGELQNWTLIQEKSPPKESPVTVHVCGECGMDFPQRQQLEAHRQSHKKPYACPDCGKTFKNEYYFKIHKRIHSGDSPFLCAECGKSCVTADSLKKHELTHTGEKNFRCDQCGKAFSQSSHLNVHVKTHTGERPHLCSICGKSYSRACDLKVHLRVHTGEKPYTCEKCGKCFYYSQGYRAHLKIHDKKPKPPTKPLGRPKQQLLVVNNQ